MQRITHMIEPFPWNCECIHSALLWRIYLFNFRGYIIPKDALDTCFHVNTYKSILFLLLIPRSPTVITTVINGSNFISHSVLHMKMHWWSAVCSFQCYYHMQSNSQTFLFSNVTFQVPLCMVSRGAFPHQSQTCLQQVSLFLDTGSSIISIKKHQAGSSEDGTTCSIQLLPLR